MPPLQRKDWFIARLLTNLAAPQGERHQGEAHRGEAHRGEAQSREGHRGEGHRGEGHRGERHRGEGHRGERHRAEGHRGEGHPGDEHPGDCRHLTICLVAAALYRYPRCFRLPQLLTELAPLGEVFAASQVSKPPAH